MKRHAIGPEAPPFGMGIGAFGIGLASKFATEKRKTPKRKLALLYLRIPLPGSGQLSGRVARGSTSRKAACGSAFRLFFFIPCKAADPRLRFGSIAVRLMD